MFINPLSLSQARNAWESYLELKDSFFERLLYLSFEVVKSFHEKFAPKFLSQGISQSREEGMFGG